MNLKELALQNQKSCTVAHTRRKNYATFDKTMDESCNSQCNRYATDSLQALKNIDYICNSQCNYYETGQNLAVQLLPQKNPQKLHTKNEEKTPVFGGGDSVILANSTNTQDTNTPHTKGDIKPVLKVVAKSELPKDGVGLINQLETQVKNESYPQIEEVKPYTQDERDRLLNQAAKPLYFHLIDCEQCSLEDNRYCGDGFGLGRRFDNLLIYFDDAANKRYVLMNQVIKARVSGRRVFVRLINDWQYLRM